MTDPSIFDELSNRLTKTKRSDSGIHNSIEISNESDRQDKIPNGDEQADSGRDSDHGIDRQPGPSTSSENLDKIDGKDRSRKKSIFSKFSNIKKIFKSNKRKSNSKLKAGEKLSKSDENIGNQFKSQSEPDILAEGNKNRVLKRFNSSSYKTKDVLSDSEMSPEKKQSSFKDAPSYIRTSLRKFKPKRNKSNTSTSSNENKSEDVTKVAEKTRAESITKSFKVEPNESFFNTSLTEESKAVSPVEASVDLEDVVQKSNRVESSAAKDRIRVAPRHRRLPTRVRGRRVSSDKRVSALPVVDEDANITLEDSNKNISNSQEFRKSSRTSSKTSLQDILISSKLSSRRNSQFSDSSIHGSPEVKRSSRNSRELKFSLGFDSQELKNSSLMNVQELKSSLNERKNSKEALMKRESGDFTVEINESRKSVEQLNKINSHKQLADILGHQDSNTIETEGKPVFINKSTKSFPSGENINVRAERPSKPPRRNINYANRAAKSKSMGNLTDSQDEELMKLFANRKSYDSEQWKEKVLETGESKPEVKNEHNKVSEFQKSREKILRRRSTRDSSESENEGGLVNKQGEVAGLKTRSGTETVFVLTSPTNDAPKEIKFPSETEKDSKILDANSIPESKTEISATSQKTVKKQPPPPSPKKPPRHVINQKLSSRSSGIPIDNSTHTKVSSNALKLDEDCKVKGAAINKEREEKVANGFQESIQKPNTGNTVAPSRIPSFNKAINRKTSTGESKEKTESEIIISKIPAKQSSVKKNPENDVEKNLVSVPASEKPLVRPNSPDSKTSVDTKIPAYSRASLRKVPKRCDYIEGSLTSDDSFDKSDTSMEEKINQEKPIAAVTTASPTSNFGFSRTKSVGNKPSIPTKPKPTETSEKKFNFQSQDLVRSKTMHASRRGDLGNVREESKIPEWIKLAKQKQSDGNSEENPSDEQTNVKPSLIPKPSLSEKPSSLIIQSRPISPPHASKSLNNRSDGQKDICIVCGRTAYMIEKCEIDKHTLHKACAKCSICSRKLTVGGIFIHDNKVLCSQHK